jgi:fibronectin type 3 domain-containing protein
MDRSFAPRIFALAAASLLTASCGYVGSPMIPLANVPQNIADLAAIQRGSVIIVHCSLPLRTTENVLIKVPPRLDLRIGEDNGHFRVEEWAQDSKPVPAGEVKDNLATYQIPAKEWIGKQVILGVRTIGSNKKASGWSNFQILPIVIPPEVPSKPVVVGTVDGFKVTWAGRGDEFRVLRRGAPEESFAVGVTQKEHEWTDTAVETGKSYEYMVQALVDLADKKLAESDLSEPTLKLYKDEFPPAAPVGLRADPTPNSVSLVWEGNTEPDLAGYRVYRAVGDGKFEKLADVSAVPSYSDTMIEKGKTYHYVVTALDKAGNESGRSPAVEIVP